MKYKVAAALICGDAFNSEEVQKLFESLAPHIDTVFVAFNGKDSDSQTQLIGLALKAGITINIKRFEWEQNFGKARQESFDMVPKDEYDWILWVDTDDILVVEDNYSLDDLFDSLDEYTRGIFLKYNYAIEPETGIVVVEQWRERFMSTSLEWKWHFRIHEVCKPTENIQYARREQVWINHQRTSGEDRGARERNRGILQQALREEPSETRYYFYLAGEMMAEADAENDMNRKKNLALAAYETFETFRVMRNSIDEDIYLATCRMAELQRMIGNYAEALSQDMEGIAMYPDWPDAMVGAAKSCMELGDWRRMLAFSDMAARTSKPNSPVSLEPMNSSFTPLMLRGIANEELGNYDDAIKDYKAALKHWHPPNQGIEERIAHIKKAKKVTNTVDQRLELRGTRSDKSICFFTNPLIETWHPEFSSKNGAGGAETCIMELAPKFAADGWRVAVFGTPGEYRGVYNGVEYWDSDEWLPQEPFEVFVSSRSPFPFESQINAKQKYLWMHDVNLGNALTPYIDKPDKIIGLTKWHVEHLHKLYGIPKDKLTVVPNGIDISKFDKSRDEDTDTSPKFIWSSSPDRGLETLLSLWPIIKARYPEATLDIYYGWAMIDKIIDSYRRAGTSHGALEHLKYKIENQLTFLGEGSGVNWVGRVPQDQLIEAMYQSNFNLYTTEFCETYMLTALQNQAAGVIPLASNLAALTENVAVKENLLDGWPRNVDYQNRFLNRLDYLINGDPDNIISMRKKGREFALTQSWENSYEVWKNLLSKKL